MNGTSKNWFKPLPSNRCFFSDCTDRAAYADMPICREHAAQAWKLFDAKEPDDYKRIVRGEAKEVAAAQRATEARSAEAKRLAKLRAGMIYYIRIGDRIKIGYTRDMYRRMGQYPPNTELLAMHPGTPLLEQQMHQQFGKYLADGREWFHPNPELDAHIAKLKAQYPSTPTMAQLRAPIYVQSTLRPRSSTVVRKV